MNKLALMVVPMLGIIAIAGLASAYPSWNLEEMTHEEKDLRMQMLGHKQEIIQDKKAYLNGEITQEQFEEIMESHMEDFESLRERARELRHSGNPEGCPMAGLEDSGGMGYGRGKGMHESPGKGMGW